MTGPREREAQLQALPPEERQMAERILDALPAARRDQALGLIGLAASGPSLRDALIHLESIVSSENFSPQHIGTLSLILQRGGENSVSALGEFSRLISLDKFNRHVEQTARLAVVRSGEDCNEALRALYFLVSNPSFTPDSLTIALPGRFLGFLEQAIRNGGGFPHLSIRAMGSLFSNSMFQPAQLTARMSREFGTWLNQVVTWSGDSRLHAMEALGSLLSNSSFDPRALDAAAARQLGEMVNYAVEYTRASVSSGASEMPGLPGWEAETVGDVTRLLNLVLGHPNFRIEMISDSGLLYRALDGSSDRIPAAIDIFYRVMRQARGRPEVLTLAAHLVEHCEDIGINPLSALHMTGALASNSSLAPLLQRSDFPGRLADMLTRMRASTQILGSTTPPSERDLETLISAFEPTGAPFLGYLARMMGRENFTPELFGRMESMMDSLARDSESPSYDLAVFMLHAALSRPGVRMSARLFNNIVALSREAAAGGPQNFGAFTPLLSSRYFRPEMIEPPAGLIFYAIRLSQPRQIGSTISGISNIISILGSGSQAQEVIRQTIRHAGRDVPAALIMLRTVVSMRQFTRREMPALLELINTTGAYSRRALHVYAALLGNPSLASEAASVEFQRKLGRLILRSRGSSASEAGMSSRALATLIRNRSFRPEMFERLELGSRAAGQAAYRVFGYMDALTQSQFTEFEDIFSAGNISFLSRMALWISRNGGDEQASLHVAFRELLKDRGTDSGFLRSDFQRFATSFDALMRGAGDLGPQAVKCFMASIRHYYFDEDESEAMGRFIRSYLLAHPGDARALAITRLSTLFGSSNREQIEILFENPALYERGRALARRLIPGVDDPNVFVNFAYGIDEVGEEAVSAIYRRYGIRYFARYSDDMLEQLHETITEGASRPTILVLYPQSDYNGAFYNGGRQLDQLLGDFNVIVYESSDETGFYNAVSDFRSRFGRTSTVIISGHGTPSTITLGDESETGMLDLSDEEELVRIASVLGANPTIILESCSTGAGENSIGALISRVLGARLYAPTESGNLTDYHISRGRVSASYSVAGQEFAGGRIAGR